MLSRFQPQIFGGSCEINPGTFYEFYIQSLMLLIGSSVWAYVIGSACGIIATLDPSRIEYRQTLDELNHFCREQCLPKELSVKLRSYFRNTIHLIRQGRYEALLGKMSTRLRGDAAFRMCEFRLRSVPFLVHPDLEPEFMCNLAIRYRTNVYSRLERVPCTDLFVVERGVVAKHGHLGVAGACFGKDLILSNESLRDMGDAIALTFVQTISLTQRDIFDLLPDYPMVCKHSSDVLWLLLLMRHDDRILQYQLVGSLSPVYSFTLAILRPPSLAGLCHRPQGGTSHGSDSCPRQGRPDGQALEDQHFRRVCDHGDVR